MSTKPLTIKISNPDIKNQSRWLGSIVTTDINPLNSYVEYEWFDVSGFIYSGKNQK
jgi:hypothetical protein